MDECETWKTEKMEEEKGQKENGQNGARKTGEMMRRSTVRRRESAEAMKKIEMIRSLDTKLQHAGPQKKRGNGNVSMVIQHRREADVRTG